MIRRPFVGLSDSSLRAKIQSVLAADRHTTVELLLVLDEIDRRGIYRVDGASSLFQYCVDHLGMSEDVAYKRIRAARAGRRFPQLLGALADGRLHLTAVVLLWPHLKRSNVEELIGATARLSKQKILRVLAEKFPRPDVVTRIQALPMVPRNPDSTPEAVEKPTQLVPEPVAHHTSAPSDPRVPESANDSARPAVLAPLAPRRFALQVTIAQETHDRLRRAQELIGFASRDVATVLDRALALLVQDLEKKKLGATDRPRSRAASTTVPRTIPAEVRRAVAARDGNRCAYLSPWGHRCTETRGLEFDHRVPLARGGVSDVSNVRQLCRTHNQLEAERVFGREFMESRRSPPAPAP